MSQLIGQHNPSNCTSIATYNQAYTTKINTEEYYSFWEDLEQCLHRHPYLSNELEAGKRSIAESCFIQ